MACRMAVQRLRLQANVRQQPPNKAALHWPAAGAQGLQAPRWHSQDVSAARLYHHTSGESPSWTSAAPEVGVAVNRHLTQVTLAAPAAAAVAEYGPKPWAETSTGAGAAAGVVEGEGIP